MTNSIEQISIEIKAKSKDQNRIRDILNSKNAYFMGIDRQKDTYFKVNFGRLKLREGNIENKLIFYNRQDVAGPKQSDTILFEYDQKSSLKDILLKSLGKFVVVEKIREIFFIENVKFHLDNVRYLGTFVEIEAIDKDGSIGREKLLEQCNYYMKIFEIEEEDLLTNSYSDIVKKSINNINRY